MDTYECGDQVATYFWPYSVCINFSPKPRMRCGQNINMWKKFMINQLLINNPYLLIMGVIW